jgi:all-trans-retinol 13,14-reductase
MYGIAKDVHSPSASRIPQRWKVPNVLQTGQNINSHGMLGVLVGAIVTCSELVRPEEIYKELLAC